MRDILTLRDEARAAGLARRVIIEPDPLYLPDPLAEYVEQAECDLLADAYARARLARYAGPRCRRCDNLVTIADRGGICRDCRLGGIS